MSKYLNPLYILGAVIALALLFIIMAGAKQSTLSDVALEQQQLKARVDTITDLKRDFADAKAKQREFLRLVNDNRIKNAIDTKEVKTNQASLSLKGLDARSAKWVIEQLVNDGYRIKKLTFERRENGIDLKTEVLF